MSFRDVMFSFFCETLTWIRLEDLGPNVHCDLMPITDRLMDRQHCLNASFAYRLADAWKLGPWLRDWHRHMHEGDGNFYSSQNFESAGTPIPTLHAYWACSAIDEVIFLYRQRRIWRSMGKFWLVRSRLRQRSYSSCYVLTTTLLTVSDMCSFITWANYNAFTEVVAVGSFSTWFHNKMQRV